MECGENGLLLPITFVIEQKPSIRHLFCDWTAIVIASVGYEGL